MNKNFSLLINSCDSYSDCWHPFFTLLKKYWPECNVPVYLNTETKSFDKDGFVTSLNNGGKEETWAERFLSAVKKIETEFVLVMLDDFFLYDYVDNNRLMKALEYISLNPDVGYISFYYNTTNKNTDSDLQGFELVPSNGQYRHTTQTCLWRKSVLEKCLDVKADPWQWEVDLNSNSFDLPYKLLTAKAGQPLVFPYAYDKYGVRRGKWFGRTAELFERNNISVDMSERGVFFPYQRVIEKSHYDLIKADGQLFWLSNGQFSGENSVYAADRESAVDLKDGNFSAEYAIPHGIQGYLRWDPVDMGGVALKDICITLTDSKGKEKTVETDKLGSTGVWYNNLLVFPLENPDPQIYISFSRNHKPVKMRISCKIICPLNEDVLENTYSKQPDNSAFAKQQKIHRFF